MLEGIRKNKTGSVRLPGVGASQFGLVQHKSPALVTFKRISGLVIFGGSSAKAFTDESNRPGPGDWLLQIPDEKHNMGNTYLSRSRYARTWFRLVRDGRDRYLHPGTGSLGCVTVDEIEKWDALWSYLILARKDNMNVGTLKVVEA